MAYWAVHKMAEKQLDRVWVGHFGIDFSSLSMSLTVGISLVICGCQMLFCTLTYMPNQGSYFIVKFS